MKKIIVFYDDWCPNCTRFVHIVKKLDLLKKIDIKRLRSDEEVNLFTDINIEKAKKQMASKIGEKWFYGYESIYRILSRLLVFIPFFPILYFLKITKIGQYLYIKLAINRKIIPLHCNNEVCGLKK